MEKSLEQSLSLGHWRSPPPPPPPPPQHQVLKEVEDSSIAASLLLDDDHAEIHQKPTEEEDEEEIFDEEEAAAQSGGDPSVLTDDLRDKIVRQVEYYFSDRNLPTDKFMSRHVRKDKQGFVPIVIIASFRRMRRLVRDLSLIEAALRTSSQLVVSEDGRKVRRLHPLPITKTRDSKLFTVIVENLPVDYSTENLHKILAYKGKILNITIHDPCSTEESKDTGKSERTFSNKRHALIEYKTTEAASTAVSDLKNQEHWRSGMRVELLHKWLGKYGLIGKRHKDKQTSETASDGQKPKSDDQHTDKAKKEVLTKQ